MSNIKNRLFLVAQSWIERGAWFFAPISWIWALIVTCKNLCYKYHIFSVVRLPIPIISVGNIVAGGTGKTPLVHLLAKQLSHKKVAILSRGYGEIPDEALLLKRRLPHVSIYIGKDRIKSAKQAISDGVDLCILDDGFQYRRLFRDMDLLLLNKNDPFGKGHYLPWGYLRDSPKRIKEADLVLSNGKDCQLEVARILSFDGEEIASIQDWKVSLFSGIAKPHAFWATAQSLNCHILDHWILSDHASIDLCLLKRFAEKSKLLGAKCLICTEKDFVRLPNTVEVPLPILFLEMEMKVAPDCPLWEKLIAKIGKKIDN